MFDIDEAEGVVRKANVARRRAERERAELNEVAKRQRVEIKRLKRLLEQAQNYIPPDVRNDKLFEEIDEALHKPEL